MFMFIYCMLGSCRKIGAAYFYIAYTCMCLFRALATCWKNAELLFSLIILTEKKCIYF